MIDCDPIKPLEGRLIHCEPQAVTKFQLIHRGLIKPLPGELIDCDPIKPLEGRLIHCGAQAARRYEVSIDRLWHDQTAPQAD